MQKKNVWAESTTMPSTTWHKHIGTIDGNGQHVKKCQEDRHHPTVAKVDDANIPTVDELCVKQATSAHLSSANQSATVPTAIPTATLTIASTVSR